LNTRNTSHSVSNTERIAAVAAPIWDVLPALETSEGDIWVWMVVFEADFVAPCDDCQASDTEEVFLDYLTGAFIMARQ
jgi:hypothetical protein